MAFKTLDQLRTVAPGLNSELGLLTDADDTWGDTAARNGYIQSAISKMWPQMGRLLRESATVVSNTVEYTLTSILDVEFIDVYDLTVTTLLATRVKTWRSFPDEAADPVVLKLIIPNLVAGTAIKVTGYAPYAIPSAGGSSCDIPPRLEAVVRAGARAEAYRAKLNQYANFQVLANENRTNALTAADILELLRQANREFEQALSKNARTMTGSHRGIGATSS